MAKRRCKCGCGTIVQGHPNKKFCNKKHKDRFWNRVNPRGIYAHLNSNNMSNDEYYFATSHPFDSDALGQD